MKILLAQLDGKIPNVALMRIAAHHRALGDQVELRRFLNLSALSPQLFWEQRPDRVYASLIFDGTRPIAERLLEIYPEALVGGTGWDVAGTLEAVGITTIAQDYSIYPEYPHSVGFSQRGCRLKCSFCVVPKKEGAIREEQSVTQVWRGEGHPKNLLLLDNDFFGQPRWEAQIDAIRRGHFRVSFCQGINARMLTEEAAQAIGSIRYSDDGFKHKRLYTAWDNKKDEERLFTGLERLVRHGVKPDQIMVYMLIGYWPGETAEDRLYRQARLRAFGARPYPMPFVRTPELVGFQRWACGGYDKKVSWERWVEAKYQPRNLTKRGERTLPLFSTHPH